MPKIPQQLGLKGSSPLNEGHALLNVGQLGLNPDRLSVVVTAPCLSRGRGPHVGLILQPASTPTPVTGNAERKAAWAEVGQEQWGGHGHGLPGVGRPWVGDTPHHIGVLWERGGQNTE